MTIAENHITVNVSGPTGLLAAIPSVLGFHPEQSLVLLCLSGSRRRIGPVVRVDLPTGRDPLLARMLARQAQAHGDDVAVITYQRSRRRPPVLDQLLTELRRRGLGVASVLAVCEGVARPADTIRTERGHAGIALPPPEHPQVRALRAADAIGGRAVLASREHVRRSIAGPVGEPLRLVRARLADARAEPSHGSDVPEAEGPVAGEWSPPPAGFRPEAPVDAASIEELPAGFETVIQQALDECAQRGEVGVPTAVTMIRWLGDDDVRDAVIVRAVRELDRPWLAMLMACARWTPDDHAAGLCAALAVVAYRHGDGALAQIAIDRCLAAEPRHRLAGLMLSVIAAGLHPRTLDLLADGPEQTGIGHFAGSALPDIRDIGSGAGAAAQVGLRACRADWD